MDIRVEKRRAILRAEPLPDKWDKIFGTFRQPYEFVRIAII